MSDKKITELTNITGANLADADEFVVVDSSASETKAITYGELKKINGNLNFADNGKAIFGAGSDLQIYHDGSNSYIDDQGTGRIIIKGNDDVRIRSGANEEMIVASSDGAVTLYHNAFPKLATTSTGVDVTGTVTADGLTVDGSSNLTNTSAGASAFALVLQNQSSDTSTAVELGFDNTSTPDKTSSLTKIGVQRVNTPYVGDTDFYFKTQSNGSSVQRLKIEATGDISFYEDTGTTPKFFWDASAESLTIGTVVNSQVPLNVSAATVGSSNAIAFLRNSSADGNGLVVDVTNTPTDYVADFRIGNSSKVRIDSSGNVGIGTSSPNAILTVNGGAVDYTSSATGTGLFHVLGGASSVYTAYIGVADDGVRFGHNGSSRALIFDVNETERMRIDSSGNLLVGTTNTALNSANSGEGVMIAPDRIEVLRDGAIPMFLNRLTSDGEILRFNKDGTTVGSIGSYSGVRPYFARPGKSGITIGGGNAITPSTDAGADYDNAVDLGDAAARFRNLYLSGGVYLGGTGAANLLDDYEEGSFTPVVADAVSGGNEATALRAYGYYTKVGRWVNIVIELTNVDTTGLTGTNDMYITGLPFAAASVTGAVVWQGVVQVASVDLSATVPYITPTITEGWTSVFLREWGDNTGTDTLTVDQLTSGAADIQITIGYQT